MHDPVTVATFLFTDIEGSTRLWEREPERMRVAMARHDELAGDAVRRHGGQLVKKTGDGLHAAFDDPSAALESALAIQHALLDLEAAGSIALRARCGLHAGVFEPRDGDYYGTEVNRAARIMAAAHGGQVLLSQEVARRIGTRLPEATTLRELGLVRLRDLERPVRVFQAVQRGLRADFPPPRALEKTPSNLPHALTRFVGRERELSELGEILGRSRLVTITGMGGLGKTRLALELAAAHLAAFADGAWLAELAPLADGERVAQSLALAMGVQEESGRPTVEALERHVRDRELLVVLDNCEHLLEPCAALTRRLLAAGENVRVLATSREALRISGESAYAIGGLAVPGPRSAAEPAAAGGYASVRLFIDRARAASPAFEAGDDELRTIAAICHRLDGIPLALELAAARVRTLDIEEIGRRLQDRFRLLASGDPSLLPRQRTLAATIDWSHDGLAPDEQALFRRLSVFAGGWDLAAAEAACGFAPLASRDVADLVDRLVEKSLALCEADKGRYRVLETVRQYAAQRLAAAGPAEESALRDRHLAHYVAFAEAAKPSLTGPEQAGGLARLDEERENLLSALAWARQRDDGARAGLRLASSLKLYWVNRGLLELGHHVTRDALEHPGAQARDGDRMRGLFHAGQILYVMGRYAPARALLEESLAIARELGDARGISATLQPLGMAAIGQGELGFARACLEEALTHAQAQGERRQLAGALNALAQLERVEGRPERTAPLYREVVRLLREVGDAEAAGVGLLNLAMVSILQGDAGVAREMVAEACESAHSTRSRPLAQSVLEVTAALAAQAGDATRAARCYGAAEALARATAVRRDPADETFLAPRITAARAALGDAAFARAEDEGRELDPAAALDESRAWLARPQ